MSQQLNTLTERLTLSLSVTKEEHAVNILLVSSLSSWSVRRSHDEMKQFHDVLSAMELCRGIYLPPLPLIHASTSNDYLLYLSKILGRVFWLRLDFVLCFVQAPLQFRRVICARYEKEAREWIKCGKLKKEGEKNKSYSKRYFVVLSNYLIVYFDSKQSFEDNKAHKGYIDLLAVSSITCDNIHKKYAFHLSTASRIWKLQCNNEQEQNQWTQFLDAYISSSKLNKYKAYIAPHRPYINGLSAMNTNVDDIFLRKNIKQCTVDKCDAVLRIASVLKYHYQLIKAMDYKNDELFYVSIDEEQHDEKHDKSNDILYNYVNQSLYPYNTLRLLNDYFHVILHHKQQYNALYQQVTFIMGTSCDIALCSCFERIERDAINSNANSNTYNSDKEGGTLHVMDQMHCYFLHAHSVGMQLTKKQWIDIQNNNDMHESKESKQEMQYNEEFERMKQQVIEQKKKVLNTCEFSEIHYGFHHKNKFMTSSISFDAQTANISHIFGYKYFYWSYYKTNDAIDAKYNIGYKIRDFYVEPKHNDLKAEIFCDDAIDAKKWDYLVRKAHSLLKCEVIKKLKANHMVVIDHLDAVIEPESVITISHVLAILMYTNMVELQRELVCTYNKQTVNESLESMKKRHSHYAHLAKYLCETVHCYGDEWIEHKNMPFYHGINTLMYFTDNILHFNHPISCSESLIVAISYLASSNDGLILKLSDVVDDNQNALKVHYFNCAIFSDFCFEEEYLLDASWSAIGVQTNTIFHVGFSTRYASHLCALRVLNDIFKGIWMKSALDESIQTMISILFNNELKSWLGINDKNIVLQENISILPQYVELSFHCFTHKMESVVIDIASLMMKKHGNRYGYFWLRELLMDQHLCFVNLPILIPLFPKCKTLQILNSVSMDSCSNSLKYILNLLLKIFKSSQFKHSTAWKQIKICGFENSSHLIQKLCSNFKQQFKENGWFLQYVFGCEKNNEIIIVLRRNELLVK